MSKLTLFSKEQEDKSMIMKSPQVFGDEQGYGRVSGRAGFRRRQGLR